MTAHSISETVSPLQRRRRIIKTMVFAIVLLSLYSLVALAADTDTGSTGDPTLGSVAKRLASTFPAIVALIQGISYIAGMGFAVSGIIKFKQHKDNPTQVPLGGPVAMVFIAAALIFLPTIISVTGESLVEGAQQGSPTGFTDTDSTGGSKTPAKK